MLNLICIAGIVLGLIHRQRAEKPIMVMIASLGAMVLISVLDGVVEGVLYRLFAAARGGGGIIDTFDTLWRWVAGLLRAAATGGLVFAVLYDRGFEIFNLLPPGKEPLKNPSAD